MWAAKTLLLNNLGKPHEPEEMTIYSLKYFAKTFGKNRVSLSKKKEIDKTELINEYVDVALNHVKESVKNIRKGDFPLTKFIENNEKVCRFCNYKTICRIDSVK